MIAFEPRKQHLLWAVLEVCYNWPLCNPEGEDPKLSMCSHVSLPFLIAADFFWETVNTTPQIRKPTNPSYNCGWRASWHVLVCKVCMVGRISSITASRKSAMPLYKYTLNTRFLLCWSKSSSIDPKACECQSTASPHPRLCGAAPGLRRFVSGV